MGELYFHLIILMDLQLLDSLQKMVDSRPTRIYVLMHLVIILWNGNHHGQVSLKVLVLLRSLPNFMITDE
jgi:hypothetical protein